eukprot:scaffold4144_cov133-Isochrysis_galbana.AAC.5
MCPAPSAAGGPARPGRGWSAWGGAATRRRKREPKAAGGSTHSPAEAWCPCHDLVAPQHQPLSRRLNVVVDPQQPVGAGARGGARLHQRGQQRNLVPLAGQVPRGQQLGRQPQPVAVRAGVLPLVLDRQREDVIALAGGARAGLSGRHEHQPAAATAGARRNVGLGQPGGGGARGWRRRRRQVLWPALRTGRLGHRLGHRRLGRLEAAGEGLVPRTIR